MKFYFSVAESRVSFPKPLQLGSGPRRQSWGSGAVPVFRSEKKQFPQGHPALGWGCCWGWGAQGGDAPGFALPCATALPPSSHTGSCAVTSGTDVVWIENNLPNPGS